MTNLTLLKSTLLLLLGSLTVDSMLMDIHLPLQPSIILGCPYSEALHSNLNLRQSYPDLEQINFFHLHTPHITLYLTDFDVEGENNTVSETKLSALTETLSNLVPHLPSCTYDVSHHSRVTETYAMLHIPKTPCLQHLSDIIVNATKSYVNFPVPVPEWVSDLPEPKRSVKTRLIQEYGSPNVFEGFDPHVTVGFEEGNQGGMTRVFKKMDSERMRPCPSKGTTLALGWSGVGGSVLQGPVLELELISEESLKIS